MAHPTNNDKHEQKPGDDLKRYLVLPDPNVISRQYTSMDIAPHVTELNIMRAERDAALTHETHWRTVAEGLMRAQGLTHPPLTINTTTTPVPVPAAQWTPRAPTYRDHCLYELVEKKCKRSQCRYVHEDQVDMYKDHIKGLSFTDMGDEQTSGG